MKYIKIVKNIWDCWNVNVCGIFERKTQKLTNYLLNLFDDVDK